MREWEIEQEERKKKQEIEKKLGEIISMPFYSIKIHW